MFSKGGILLENIEKKQCQFSLLQKEYSMGKMYEGNISLVFSAPWKVKYLVYSTVGAQSIARLCQNLVNCRGNISAHRRRRKLRFFFIRKIFGWRVN
jgi:hypothetical protein